MTDSGQPKLKHLSGQCPRTCMVMQGVNGLSPKKKLYIYRIFSIRKLSTVSNYGIHSATWHTFPLPGRHCSTSKESTCVWCSLITAAFSYLQAAKQSLCNGTSGQVLEEVWYFFHCIFTRVIFKRKFSDANKFRMWLTFPNISTVEYFHYEYVVYRQLPDIGLR